MSERLVLDPRAIDPSRGELDLHSGAITVAQDGPTWGDAVVESYMAEGDFGSDQIDMSTPNRTVEIPLVLQATRTVSFADARRLLQQKAATLQRHGGSLLREIDDEPMYMDVVRASLRLGGDTLQALGFVDANALLTLEYRPDGYGEEQLLGSGTIAGGGSIALDDVPGDYPARTRIVITDTSGNDQRTVLFATRPTNTDATAAMDYEATDLTPQGGATIRTGYVEYASLPPFWISTLSTDVDDVGPMTHVGPHRVLALIERVLGRDRMQIRLEWSVGADAAPRENDTVTLVDGKSWVDLGMVQAVPVRNEQPQWTGLISAYGEAASTIRIYRVLVQPIAYGSGRVAALTTMRSMPSADAWDDFADQESSDDLDGRTSGSGDTWSGAGVATDAIQVSTEGDAFRDSTRDPGGDPGDLWGGQLGSGRLAILGSSSVYTMSSVWIDVEAHTDGFVLCGPVARYVDSRNWLMGGLLQGVQGFGFFACYAAIVKCVSGTISIIGLRALSGGPLLGNHAYVLISDNVGDAGLNIDGTRYVNALDPDLATGGVLARGKAGIYDSCGGSALSTITRSYTRFVVSNAEAVEDRAIYANRWAEITTDGYRRAGSTDDAMAGLVIAGSNPRLEPGATELYVRQMRSQLGQPATDTDDPASVDVYGRPCYLFTPQPAS